MKASVIIPVLYDEPQLAATLEGLSTVLDQVELEILVVVDVPDPAREVAARRTNDAVAAGAGARVVYRIGERGFGSALRFGFANATGDALIPYMADRSDDPLTIPAMIEVLGRGWDVVAGSRYMPGGGVVGDTTKQRLSRFYSSLMRLVGGIPIHDVSNAFKAYGRAVIETVPSVADSFDVSVELTVRAARAGFRIAEVPTVWTNRVLGSSNFRMGRELRNYGRWLGLALAGRFRTHSRPATTAIRPGPADAL